MRLFILIILSSLGLADTPADLSQLNPLEARVFSTSSSPQDQELVDLQIEMTLQEGFFAYEERFRLSSTEPSDLKIGELFIDPIVEFDDTFSKKTKRGVKNTGTLKTQIEIPDHVYQDHQAIKLELTYIACTDKFCLTPRTVPLELKLEQRASIEPKQNESSYIQEQIEENLLYALILIFFFGLLTSLTPCVYPLIPITMAILGTEKQRSQIQSFLISLCYVLGIGITYAILGVIAAQTGQLFGSLISHPVVVIAMSLIFFAMGLSLLGVFELQAPHFIRKRLNESQEQRGYVGAFLAGLVAGVIASPCVGPVLVGILAYIARTQNSFLGFILLFTFAMGFGMLFLALGTFSQLANRIPRSGGWMNGVKTVLAIILFGLSFYYVYPLVKTLLPQPQISKNREGVRWQKFSDELLKKAQEEKRPVIIDFYADWCVACVEMDELTFSKENIIEKSSGFVMLKVDATLPSKEINDLQKRFQVYGLPTMLFIGVDGKVREDLTLTGFEESDLFIKRMETLLNENIEQK